MILEVLIGPIFAVQLAFHLLSRRSERKLQLFTYCIRRYQGPRTWLRKGLIAVFNGHRSVPMFVTNFPPSQVSRAITKGRELTMWNTWQIGVRVRLNCNNVTLTPIIDPYYYKIFSELDGYIKFYKNLSQLDFNLPSMRTTAICSNDTSKQKDASLSQLILNGYCIFQQFGSSFLVRYFYSLRPNTNVVCPTSFLNSSRCSR